MRLAVFLALVLVPAPAVAKCARMGLAPSVLTPADSAITIGGGIVVGATDAQGDQLDPGDVAVQPTWRFAGVATAPVIDLIAPGLAVYRLPATATKATLEDAKHGVRVRVTVGDDKPLVLDAPKPKAIKHTAGMGRRPFTHIVVELREAIPPGAIAIVLADAAGKPRSWHRVDAGAMTASVFDISRCRVLPNGTIESKGGDLVTLFWVDRAGRKSPASKPFAITHVATPGAVID
ncbi:MAG: hypothetical protein ABI867_23410 [Kofleriaceae bacterium]